MRCAGIESTIGASRQARNFPERLFGSRVEALLEHESRNPAQPELAGLGAEVVDILFHGVADIDQRLDLGCFGLAARMGKHFANLAISAAAIDFLHPRLQRRRLASPPPCPSVGA